MTTLKGIFPDPKPARKKNFIHENVKNLRRMEQCFNNNNKELDVNKIYSRKQEKPADKYQNVVARINTGFREKKLDDTSADLSANGKIADCEIINRKSSAPILHKDSANLKKTRSRAERNTNIMTKQKKRDKRILEKGTQKLKGKVLSDPNFSLPSDDASQPKYKSQAIQTLDSKDIEDIYSEGSIRYPSNKSANKPEAVKKDNSCKDAQNTLPEMPGPPSDRGDTNIAEEPKEESSNNNELHLYKADVDFVKMNKERTSMASKIAAHINNTSALPANYRKGVVPKYIRNRKEAQEKEEREKAEAFDPNCPEGHVSLPDNERKETLRMLKKNYQEYVQELNRMPIKTDTLRAQRRKVEIEKQLTKLEEGIKVFSRPKVYVKVDA